MVTKRGDKDIPCLISRLLWQKILLYPRRCTIRIYSNVQVLTFLSVFISLHSLSNAALSISGRKWTSGRTRRSVQWKANLSALSFPSSNSSWTTKSIFVQFTGLKLELLSLLPTGKRSRSLCWTEAKKCSKPGISPASFASSTSTASVKFPSVEKPTRQRTWSSSMCISSETNRSLCISSAAPARPERRKKPRPRQLLPSIQTSTIPEAGAAAIYQLRAGLTEMLTKLMGRLARVPSRRQTKVVVSSTTRRIRHSYLLARPLPPTRLWKTTCTRSFRRNEMLCSCYWAYGIQLQHQSLKACHLRLKYPSSRCVFQCILSIPLRLQFLDLTTITERFGKHGVLCKRRSSIARPKIASQCGSKIVKIFGNVNILTAIRNSFGDNLVEHFF